MSVCRDCKNYFPIEQEKDKGDCVQRVVDPRQAYFKARPVGAENDASACSEFVKK